METVELGAVMKAIGNGSKLKKINEGKTKEIYEIPGFPDLALIRSKDRITAFNAQRSNQIEGKSAIANETTCNVFRYLKEIGLKTHFYCKLSEGEFLAKRCAMIPLEWVARRVATGSFLKRNPGVEQGYRFTPLKQEIFYKDDANNDPEFSEEQVIASKITAAGVQIRQREVELMKKLTILVFEALEKAWAINKCALIDMKVEFGVTDDGSIVLADVIDNDSWRIWPENDKRLQLDKQFYRDLDQVTDEALSRLKENYAYVAKITKSFVDQQSNCRVVVLMGSGSDKKYADQIVERCIQLGVPAIKRVTSAHKTTIDTLNTLAEYEGDGIATVFVAVAGRSNGLGPVSAAHTTYPVINAPPISPEWAAEDIWSSLRMPSGIGCSTVLGADEAALAAAKMLSLTNHIVFGHLLVHKLLNYISVMKADRRLEGENVSMLSNFDRKDSVVMASSAKQ